MEAEHTQETDADDTQQHVLLDVTEDSPPRTVLVAWVNAQLERRGEEGCVKDFDREFFTGTTLCTVIEVLVATTGGSPPILETMEIGDGDQQNLNRAIDMSAKAGLYLGTLDVEDLIHNSESATRLIWRIAIFFRVLVPFGVVSQGDERSDSPWTGVLPMAHMHMFEYICRGLEDLPLPTDLYASWLTGLPFLSIIFRLEPSLLPGYPATYVKRSAAENLQLAFKLAETHFFVPRILHSIEDTLVPHDTCIGASLLLYIAEFCHTWRQMTATQADRSATWNHSAVGNSVESTVLKGPSINGRQGERVRVKVVPLAPEEEDENIEQIAQEACDNNGEIFSGDEVLIRKDEIIVEDGELKVKQVVVERPPLFDGQAVRITTEQVLADNLPHNIEGPIHDLREELSEESGQEHPTLYQNMFASNDVVTPTPHQLRHLSPENGFHTDTHGDSNTNGSRSGAGGGGDGTNTTALPTLSDQGQEGSDLRLVRKRAKHEQAQLDQHVSSLQDHLAPRVVVAGRQSPPVSDQVAMAVDQVGGSDTGHSTTSTTTSTENHAVRGKLRERDDAGAEEEHENRVDHHHTHAHTSSSSSLTPEGEPDGHPTA